MCICFHLSYETFINTIFSFCWDNRFQKMVKKCQLALCWHLNWLNYLFCFRFSVNFLLCLVGTLLPTRMPTDVPTRIDPVQAILQPILFNGAPNYKTHEFTKSSSLQYSWIHSLQCTEGFKLLLVCDAPNYSTNKACKDFKIVTFLTL